MALTVGAIMLTRPVLRPVRSASNADPAGTTVPIVVTFIHARLIDINALATRLVWRHPFAVAIRLFCVSSQSVLRHERWCVDSPRRTMLRHLRLGFVPVCDRKVPKRSQSLIR
jgi:hypothetical protein